MPAFSPYHDLVSDCPRAAQRDLAPTSQPRYPSPLARLLPSLPTRARIPVCPLSLASRPHCTLYWGRPLPQSPLAPGVLASYHPTFIGLLTSHARFLSLQPPFAQRDERGAHGALGEPSSPRPHYFPSSSFSSLSQHLPCTCWHLCRTEYPQAKWEAEPWIRIRTYKRNPEGAKGPLYR